MNFTFTTVYRVAQNDFYARPYTSMWAPVVAPQISKGYSSLCLLDRASCWRIKDQASACNTDTTPTQPHRNSNTHRTKNNTTNVVIQQNSRKLLMMHILMSETCWARKKWNKIASDIKLILKLLPRVYHHVRCHKLQVIVVTVVS